MTGPPPASAPPGAPPVFPGYPCPPPMRFKPGEPFISHLSYMEGQFAAQALIVEQQRRIKALEAELSTTQMELMRLRSMSTPQRAVSNSRVQQPMRHDSQSQQAAGGTQTQEEAKKASSRYWTPEEHKRFLEGLELFGQKDIKAISRHVGTRSATQVRTHAQKYYLRIQRERVKAEAEGKPPPIVPNGTPLRKSKASPSGNGGNSNQSNSGSHSNSHVNTSRPSNSHSNSHNNSSSSTRNQLSTANNHVSNSHNHTPASENAANDSTLPTKSQQVIHTAPQPPMPYVSRPFLTPNPSSVLPSTSNGPIQVQNVSLDASDRSFQPSMKPTMHSVQTAMAVPNSSVGGMPMGSNPMGSNPPANVIGHQNVQNAKAESVSSAAQVQQAEQKPSLQSLQLVQARPRASTQVKKETGLEKEATKRSAPPTPKKSPKKRAKKPTTPSTSLAPPCSISLSQPSPPDTDTPTSMSIPASAAQPPTHPLGESGGSMSNLRALLRVPDDMGPSSSKPPTLRRNGSSNSVLADLSKNCGVLSRSNSFISPSGKGFTRSNSILSLLSGIPTALRESPSTERLLGLDGGEDKVMATLKSMETGGSAGAGATNAVGAMGDRTFSFGQLNHMGLDDLEDPGTVALALPEEQKWVDG